jgi:DHA1 family solute carrier family 18 vesicular amine transporter 1/2
MNRRQPIFVAFLVGWAIFCDMTIYGILLPVLPKAGLQKGMSMELVGFALSVYSLGAIVTPFICYLSDHYKNQKIPFALSALFLSFASCLFGISQDSFGFMVSRLLQGITGGVSWSIGFSMLADAYPSGLGKTLGIVMSLNTLGNLVGPLVGGVLLDQFGLPYPFYACFAIALVDFLIRWTLRPPVWSISYDACENGLEQDLTDPLLNQDSEEEPSSDEPSENTQSVGFLTLLGSSDMLLTLFNLVVGQAVLTGIEPTLPVFLEKVYGLSSSEIGILWMFLSVPKAIGSALAGTMSDKYGRKLVSFYGFAILTLSCGLLSQTSQFRIFLIGLFLFGLGSAFALTPAVPEMSDIARKMNFQNFGTLYGLYNFTSSVGMMIGPIVGSAIFSVYGFPIQIIIFGISILAPILISIPFLSETK